jgi:hypothetical protein
MRRFGLALALVIAAVSTSCGGDDEPAAEGSDAAEPVVTSSDAAEFHVLQVWDESVGLYIEGARSFVRIETAAGEEIVEAELQSTPAGDEARILLDPGRYRLLSWQRPSSGASGVYDPPTDRCDAPFEVQPQTPVEARIEVRAAQGCTIRFDEV